MDAILFDMDDTLYDQAQPLACAVRKVVGELPGVTADELYKASRRHSGEVFAAYAAGGRPTDAIYVRRMRQTMADFGVKVSDDVALRLQRAYTARNPEAMRLSPAMVRTLDLCRAHARRGLGIVTNGTLDRQMDKWRELGLSRWIPRERVFVSDELGVAKPDPAIFLHSLGAMGASADASLFVGDAYQIDVVGAHAAGIRVAWLDRRRNGMPKDANGPRADWTVHTDEELASLMARLLGQED
jgi:HAD superfamily hydrolase (TIGR01549 family)